MVADLIAGGIVESRLHLSLTSHLHVDIEQAVAVLIVLTHKDVLDVSLRTGIEIHLSGDARKAPEVLILEI